MTDYITNNDNRNKLERIIREIIIMVKAVVIVFCLITIIAGAFYVKGYVEAKKKQNSTRVEITTLVLEERLHDAAKLVAQEFTYTNTKRIENCKQLWGHDVGITEHVIEMEYSGKINVSLDLSKAIVKLKGKMIYIKLPDAYVTDNYIDINSLKVNKNNNIFNRIKDEEIKSALAETETEELQRAIDQGILEKAKEHAQKVISGLFIDLDEYNVVFL